MKKILLIVSALVLGLASCTQKELGPVTPDGENVTVSFTTSIQGADDAATRAYSDGYTAKSLKYFVYDETDEQSPVYLDQLSGIAAFDEGQLTQTISLELVTGKYYSIVFWAEAEFGEGETNPYSYDTGTKEITVAYGGAAQNEKRDAFYAYKGRFKVGGALSEPITLKRPFAQINIGTNDYDAAEKSGVTPVESGMKVKGVSESINLATGVVGEPLEREVVFEAATIKKDETFPVEGYTYLGMNYVLVGEAKSLVDVTLNYGIDDVVFTQVPVQRNYRTNIYGSILTDPNGFEVTIEPGYGNDLGYEVEDEVVVVSNVEEANGVLAAGATNVVIEGTLTEDATVVIPRMYEEGNIQAISITLPTTDKNITIEYDDQTQSAPKNIAVKANTTGKLTIITPESTVTISGSFGELDATTADDTLIVGEDAEVENLTVRKGNVVIYGTVKSILFHKDAGVVKLWQVRDAENLGYAAAVEEDRCEKIVLADNADITLAKDIDFGNRPVWFAGKVDLGGNTVRLGRENWIEVEKDLVITNGTIDNTDAIEPVEGHQKSLIHVRGGKFVLDGVRLINDMGYHWHGSTSDRPYNSAAVAYWNDARIIIRNSRIYSGEFTLCGMGRNGANTADVYLVDSYFESNSSNVNNGSHWAYAMRVFGSKIILENCEVKGIQGAVSIEECVDAEIKSGKYYTVNTPGKKDAFYALYVTGGAVVKVTGGDFSGAMNRDALAEGTSAIVSGDNDVNSPLGTYIITGGRFSGKAYNHVTKKVYEPAEGYEWRAIEGGEVLGDMPLVWEVVPVAE